MKYVGKLSTLCLSIFAILFSLYPPLAFSSEKPQELLIYVPTEYPISLLLEDGIAQFSKTHPEVKLTVERISGLGSNSPYGKRLQTELLSGKGPDVVVVDSLTFLDPYKIFESGILAALDPLMVADSEYKSDDFNLTVFEAGVYHNQRYALPLNYEVILFMSTDEIIEAANIDMEKTTDFWGFMGEINNYILSNNGKDVFSFRNTIAWPLLPICGLSILDYENQRAIVDTAEFRKFCDVCKPFFALDYEKFTGGTIYSSTRDAYDGLREDKYLFCNMPSLSDVAFTASALASTAHPVVQAIPTINGGYKAIIRYALGIPNASNHKTEAYEFIKTMLSSTIQQSSNQLYAPVRVDALQFWIDETMSEFDQPQYDSQTSIQLSKISDTVKRQCIDIYTSINECSFSNFEVDAKIYDNILPYLQDERSLDDCINRIQNELDIYITE